MCNTLFYCNVYDVENHKNKYRGLKENDNPSEDIAVHLSRDERFPSYGLTSTSMVCYTALLPSKDISSNASVR